MRKLFLLIVLFTAATTVQSQERSLKKVISLKMPKTAEDFLCGTRGASVVWHPVQNKYYAVFAGNQGFPLAIFDKTGKRLSDDEQTTLVDIRGLWYDPFTKTICGNGYDTIGWFKYVLGKNGVPTDYTIIKNGMYQPNKQSVGSFNKKAGYVYFLDGGQVAFYKPDADISEKSVTIHWGLKKGQVNEDEENIYETREGYNMTSAVYTGFIGSEIALLNTDAKQIELYDEKEGYMKQKLLLPEEAPVESMFNFAFANGIFWLFDIPNRTWIGYK